MDDQGFVDFFCEVDNLLEVLFLLLVVGFIPMIIQAAFANCNDKLWIVLRIFPDLFEYVIVEMIRFVWMYSLGALHRLMVPCYIEYRFEVARAYRNGDDVFNAYSGCIGNTCCGIDIKIIKMAVGLDYR